MSIENKVPYSFIAGTRAKASQVNENFKVLLQNEMLLDSSKAEIEGNESKNFSVKDPINPQHAVTKKYVDDLIEEKLGTRGAGIGKALFEVFHTASLDTPPGAFSLRTGETIPNAYEYYPTFIEALREKGSGEIDDLTNVTVSEDYKMESDAGTPLGSVPELRAFSPSSCITVPYSQGSAVSLYLTVPEAITCDAFKLNSYVSASYNSSDSGLDPNPLRAIKKATISVLYSAEELPVSELKGWINAAVISESEAPDKNYRFYPNAQPDYAFNHIRVVIEENFDAEALDIGVYPFNFNSNSVRLVPYEQWKYEIDSYGQTGSFAYDQEKDEAYLPKVNGLLSGVEDLWDIGTTSSILFSSSSALEWEDPSAEPETENKKELNSTSMFSSGLWLQCYNAIAEEAISNMRYVTNAVLLEERDFRYIPEKFTGWYKVDPEAWRDSEYFVSAWSEIKSAYDSAFEKETANIVFYRPLDFDPVAPLEEYSYKIKVDPTSKMSFVSPEAYDFLKDTIGECNYYAIKEEIDEDGVIHYFFKTPFSNYDYANVFSLFNQSAPDWSKPETKKANTTHTATENGWIRWVCNEADTTRDLKINGATVARVRAAASKDDSGAAAFLPVSKGDTFLGQKSNVTFYPCKGEYYSQENIKENDLLYRCVFLGNEIPQSQQVNTSKRLDKIEKEVAELSMGSTGEVGKLTVKVDALEESVASNTASIESITDPENGSIPSIEREVEGLQASVDTFAASLDSISASFEITQNTAIAASTQVQALQQLVDDLNARVSALESRLTEAENISDDILGN